MIFYLFALVTCLNYAFAEEITEQQIINSVNNHYPLIQEAVLKYEASKGEYEASLGSFDHKVKFKTRNNIENVYDNQYFETAIERKTPFYGIGLIAGHRQGSGKFAEYDGYYRTSSAGELFAGLTLPILRNFANDEARLGARIAKINQDIAKQELMTKKMTAFHKALSLYYKWLLECKKLQIRRNILALATNRQEMIEKKFKAGDVEKLKIKDNLRSIDKRRDEVLKNEIDLKRIAMELSLYLRNNSGISIIPSENQAPTDPQIHQDMRLSGFKWEKIPQLQILNLQYEAMKQQKDFNKNQRLPGLNLDVLASRELSGDIPYDPETIKIGVSFDFPLENRKASGKTVSSEYKSMAIQKQKQYLHQELERFYNFSVDSMKASLERFKVVTREYENTKIMADAEKKRWLQGESDLFIFNLREQDIAEADIKRWTTLFDSQQFHVDAKLFSGQLVEGL